MLQSTYFKLRTMSPCCLSHLDFDVEVHDEDDIQVLVTGICIGVGEPPTLMNGLIDIASDAKNDQAKSKSTTSVFVCGLHVFPACMYCIKFYN